MTDEQPPVNHVPIQPTPISYEFRKVLMNGVPAVSLEFRSFTGSFISLWGPDDLTPMIDEMIRVRDSAKNSPIIAGASPGGIILPS